MSSSQQWKFVIHGLTRLIFPFLSYSTPRILVPEKCLNDKYELRVRSRTAYSRWAYINPPPHSPLPPFPPSPIPPFPPPPPVNGTLILITVGGCLRFHKFSEFR